MGILTPVLCKQCVEASLFFFRQRDRMQCIPIITNVGFGLSAMVLADEKILANKIQGIAFNALTNAFNECIGHCS